ncbi:MAG: SsrA-binding protein SmpB [Candidatus Zixiibacteriota bacterium]|nr:MAG: SsrA-binding protein SmpB [candidate division Zixibacteria bacterium]
MSKKPEKQPESDIKIVATNRKARRDYEVLQTVEAGLSLLGSEVKSLRAGKANLKDAYAIARGNEIFLLNMHISPYDKTGYSGHDPERQRKLLLHAREIGKLINMVDEKGMTLIPLRLYFRGKYAKVELGVCRGKRAYDKRAAIIERDTRRDMEREMKRRK